MGGQFVGYYYDWDTMDWKSTTKPAKRTRQRCAYRETLLELLLEEKRNGDFVTQLYAGLLADALRTMPTRHRREAIK